MAEAAQLITDEMRSAVGRQLGRQVSFPVAASDIRRWALAVYYPAPPPRQFWDEAYARESAHGGIVAPEEFNPFAWMVKEPTIGTAEPARSIEANLGIQEPATQFMLNGGAEIEYETLMRPGDVVTATNVLAGYEQREGRLGSMLFTRTTNRWVNQDRRTVKTATSTLIRY
jgi:hypothetical protein